MIKKEAYGRRETQARNAECERMKQKKIHGGRRQETDEKGEINVTNMRKEGHQEKRKGFVVKIEGKERPLAGQRQGASW